MFLAFNAVARLFWPRLETTVWLMDVRRWNGLVGFAVIALGASGLLGFAVWPRMARWRRSGLLGILGLLATIAVVDCVRVYLLRSSGAIQASSPVAFSAIVVGGLAIVAWGVASRSMKPLRFGSAVAVCVAGVCFAAFPLILMVTFGLTDYRRQADAIVVFGARAYANGRPSSALSDRMKTACELYREGFAAHLILSGGSGDGNLHETDVMRRVALEAGVPESALILDRDGVNTRATLANTRLIAEHRGFHRVLAVSHFYHLPRIKLQADREGLTCFTVPSPQERPLAALPYFIAREAAACWKYFLRL